MTYRRLLPAVLLFLCAACFTSCTTKSALRVRKLSDGLTEENYLRTIDYIEKHPKMYGKTNRLLYNMDIGALYHYAGKYDSSTQYLMRSADIYHDLFARSVTNEAASVMINDNIRPYRSKPYELVMMHQFLASNFLAKGDIESALVETRRTQLLFDEWKRKNGDGEKYHSDPMFHYFSSIAYDAADETSDAMISLYHAVDAFRKGPVALPPEIAAYARHMFKLNDREGDIDLLNLSGEGGTGNRKEYENGATEIVFIGYAGRGPLFKEQSWWGTWVKDGLLVVHHNAPDGTMETITLPAPGLPPSELKKAEKGQKTRSGTTFHIKFALPALEPVSSVTESFTVRRKGDGSTYQSVVVNNIDLQAKKYLEDTRGVTLARTVVRVVLRTIAAQKAKNKMQTGNTAANLLLNIGTDILADQLEKADTRSCFLLPKTVHIVRIPVTAGTYSLDVAARGKGGKIIATKTFSDISVRSHEKKFVFFTSFK